MTTTSVAPAPRPARIDGAGDAPIAITGGAGFVGTQICRVLARKGHAIRVLVRNREKASSRLAGLAVDIHTGDVREPATLRTFVDGAEAVIHLAAIAIERRGETYESVNTDATVRLIAAMRDAGVRRLVHMSQNGAASTLPYRFLRSKGIAEDAVAGSDLDWTILRPSVIFGLGDEFVNVLARLVRLSPIVFPLPGGGTARFQPVAVTDVAAAAVAALDGPRAIGRRLSLGGPVPLTLREMTKWILLAMDAKRVLVPLPVPVMRPLVAVMQRVLPNPPVTTSLLDLLGVENTIERNDLEQFFAIAPVPFHPDTIAYLRGITIRDALRSFFG